ncbi:hypothetical protein X777_07624 [Ooceraea biroi]|uniref:Uncharacterized protein n=1 Tax=Ooceraea biroi TaxID=2015173 RepID=A0A026X3G0_OOCBI|nr:hypothetical protein X777_07624 [Ooceraea biroi]
MELVRAIGSRMDAPRAEIEHQEERVDGRDNAHVERTGRKRARESWRSLAHSLAYRRH